MSDEAEFERIKGWVGFTDSDGNVALTTDPTLALNPYTVGDPFPIYRRKESK